MEFNEFWQLVRNKRQTILSIVLIVVVLSLGLSLTQALKYRAQSRLLVIQEEAVSDAYHWSRSNEYLGNLFSEIVYSQSFYNLVMSEQRYAVDKNYFSGNHQQQLKTWRKTIDAKSQGDTGILRINIYHPNPQQAEQIALAVNNILINQGQNYHGNQNIRINIIDQPLVSNYPLKPNLPYVGLTALLASLVLALFYIYIFPESKYDLVFFTTGKKEKKDKKKKLPKEDNNQEIDSELELRGDEFQKEDKEEENDNPLIMKNNSQLNEYYQNLGESQEENKYQEEEIDEFQPEEDLRGNIDNIVRDR